MKRTFQTLTCLFIILTATRALAEFRSAKEMQKECRVALDVLNKRADTTYENTLYTGECIGYVQAAADGALAMAQNVTWYKICLPDNVSTQLLIQKFIAFVDKYPQYTLASTAMQLMLRDEFPCRDAKGSRPR